MSENDRLAALLQAANDVVMQRGGDAALRANGLALTSARAMDRLVGALVGYDAASPAPTLDRERLARALLVALPCEDPEEECDADGRDDHRWCDWCIARAVTVTHAAAIADAYDADA